MTVLEEYFKLDKDYKRQYGEKTFLLYQVGSFFEVYGLDPENMKNIKLFCDICGLNIANKKMCVGQNNVVMCGFRDYLLEKYIEKIHPYGYSVVVYVQKQNKIGDVIQITREEHGIFSPGTTFLDNTTNLSNNICCVWIQHVNTINKQAYIFGLSNIDIYSGTTNLCEYYENFYHSPTTYDCIEKFLNIYNPIEILFIHNIETSMMESIMSYLSLNCKKHYVVDLKNTESFLSQQAIKCESQVYQDEIIKTFFPQVNIEIFKYNLNDKVICIQSYCFLLNFVQQHNVSLIDKIQEPFIEHIQKTLVCANHSLRQLNFIHQHHTQEDYKLKYDDDQEEPISVDCVISILNQCKTKMGKRYLNMILLNPICNVEELQQRYNIIEHFNKKKYVFDEYLRQIKDLDKYMTKMKLHRINPNDIYHIYQTTLIVNSVCQIIKRDKFIKSILNVDQMHELHGSFQSYLDTTFDIDTCQQIQSQNFEKYDDVNHLFIKRSNFPKLDEQVKIKLESKDKLDCILAYVETCFMKKDKEKGKVDFIKRHLPSASELCLIVTRKRAEQLKQVINTMKQKQEHIKPLTFLSTFTSHKETFDFDITNIYFKDYNKSSCIICSQQIDLLINNIYNNNLVFQEILCQSYTKIMKHIYHKYYNQLLSYIHFIKILDVYNNFAYLSRRYNLCKPHICDDNDGCSFIQSKQMRHILIENIDKNEIYVSNDIELGTKDDNLGMLLFGTNAVGKTSLIKALGICIIMAQSGCYVPAKTFRYFPYKYIFTRIIGNDNIFKGLSTFGVEMSELRVILNQCNENSLILGDELCSGTELDSALAIFMSSLMHMSSKKSNFIFATHFHEVQELKEMDSLNTVQLKHMQVVYNNETGKLVYDRKLKDGSGDRIYGLEVCKSLHMPDEFINMCYGVRNNYINNKNNVLLLKTSKHNNSKIRSKCEFCRKQMGTEIHHLQYQKDANENAYINESFHKNHIANLASICEDCHHHIHSLNLVYERRKTMDGTYEFVLKKSKNNK
jgi:DNA mismatch repair protein MutS